MWEVTKPRTTIMTGDIFVTPIPLYVSSHIQQLNINVDDLTVQLKTDS